MTRKSETARQRYLQEQPADGPEAPPAAGPGPADPLADLETGANLPVEEVFTPFPKRAAGIEAEPEIQPASATQPIKVRGAARPKAKPARRWMAIGLIGLAGMTLLAGSLLIGLMLRFSPGFAARVTAIFTPTPQMAVAFASGKGRAATVTTDVDGKASLADPVTQQPVEVSVRAGESGAPLSNIEVNYLSDGVQVLVIAVDPSGQRAPVVVQPEPQTDVTQPRVIVIDMRLLSSFGTAQEIMDYYLNQYPLQSWNWGVEDTCLTGEELADRLNPEKARGMYFIPLIGAGTLASDPEQAQGMLQFLRTVIQQTGVSDMGLPGVLRLRFYRLAPLPLTLLEWQGFCRPTLTGQQLSFIRGGDVYVMDPAGQESAVTHSADIYSYTWSPDGNTLAVYKGNQLCFVKMDGSTPDACVAIDQPLHQNGQGVSKEFANNSRVRWAPDAKHISIYVEDSFQGGDSPCYVGGPTMLVIIPVPSFSPITTINVNGKDMGVTWTDLADPSQDSCAQVGDSIFLQDGTLVVEFTSPMHCGSGGCFYTPFRYDYNTERFTRDDFLLGDNLFKSPDGKFVASQSTHQVGVPYVSTKISIFNMVTRRRQDFTFEQEFLTQFSFSPDGRKIVWHWTLNTGPGSSIQIWDYAANQRSNLGVGETPAWSPDGAWIAYLQISADRGVMTAYTYNYELPICLYAAASDQPPDCGAETGRMLSWRPVYSIAQ